MMPECDSVDLVSGLENLNRPVVRQLTNALVVVTYDQHEVEKEKYCHDKRRRRVSGVISWERLD